MINEIDSNKFQKLLVKIIDRINQDDGSLFSNEEEEKLQEIFSLNHDQITLLIETLKSLIVQIANNYIKPSIIAADLRESGFAENKMLIFLETWASKSSKIFEQNKNACKTLPNELSDVNCKIKVQTNETSKSNIKTPLVQVDLVLTSENNVSLDFNHQELTSFYNQLEEIQNQVDVLLYSKNK